MRRPRHPRQWRGGGGGRGSGGRRQQPGHRLDQPAQGGLQVQFLHPHGELARGAGDGPEPEDAAAAEQQKLFVDGGYTD